MAFFEWLAAVPGTIVTILSAIPDILTNYGTALLDGLQQTLAITFTAFVGAFAIGVVLATFRVSPIPVLRQVAALYTEFFRNLPLTVLAFFVIFALPNLQLVFSPFWSGTLALTLYTGAFMGEVLRSGINSVAAGEVEAARAVGMSFGQVLRLVVMPQALRTVVGPIGSLFIAHTKNTTALVVCSALELGDVTRRVGSATADNFTVSLIVAGIFVLMLTPAGAGFAWLERKVAIKR